MSAGPPASGIEWLHAFMSLGCVHNNNWELQGGGVLLLDQPVVWLVTATKVIEDLDGQDLVTWVRRKDSVNLLNISETQRKTELDWLHHPCGRSQLHHPSVLASTMHQGARSPTDDAGGFVRQLDGPRHSARPT